MDNPYLNMLRTDSEGSLLLNQIDSAPKSARKLVDEAGLDRPADSVRFLEHFREHTLKTEYFR